MKNLFSIWLSLIRKVRISLSYHSYENNIGKQVFKKRHTNKLKDIQNPKEPKPFKSGLKINTIKGVIEHPILNKPAYIFEEDDSYVLCEGCYLV